MEGIAKIRTLKMHNEKFDGYLTLIAAGDEYLAKFTHLGKMPVYSEVRNIKAFITDAQKHGWKITIMEVE